MDPREKVCEYMSSTELAQNRAQMQHTILRPEASCLNFTTFQCPITLMRDLQAVIDIIPTTEDL